MKKIHLKRSKRSMPRRMPAPMRIGQGIMNAAFTFWTVRDIRKRSDDEIKGNRKVWTVAAFAPPIGPIAYFLFGRKRNADGMEHQPATTPQI